MKAENKFPMVEALMRYEATLGHVSLIGELRELLEFWEAHQWRPKETLTKEELIKQGNVMIFSAGARFSTPTPFGYPFTHWMPLPKGPK